MRTTIEKKNPNSVCPGFRVINDDGFVWELAYPSKELMEKAHEKKYRASIADRRIAHSDFECTGHHIAWADTIEELIEDIRCFKAPYYSCDEFLEQLRKSDSEDVRDDLQVELYHDSRGTYITRGHLSYKNMTGYTSF